MSEQSSKDANAPIDESVKEDPLAELARIVSAGSVFGEISDPSENKPIDLGAPFQADIASEQPSNPVDAASLVGDVKEVELPDFMSSSVQDDPKAEAPSNELEAELGIQLEEELFNELQRDPEIALSNTASEEVNLDDIVNEIAPSPLNTVGADEVSSIAKPEELAGSQSAMENPSIASVATTEAMNTATITDELTKDVPQPNAIEEAYNLDSFFDAEFASVTQGATPSSGGLIDGAPVDSSVSVSVDAFKGVGGDVDPLDEINLDSENEHFSYDLDDEAHSNRGRSLLAVAAVLLIAVIGGSAAYYVFGIGENGDSDIVVAASDEPVRVKPTDPGGKTIPNQDRTVYDAISGSEKNQDTTGDLVDSSESLIVGVGDDVEKSTPRVVLPGLSNDAPISSTTPPKGPRSVRTVVIRPDGSIVPETKTPKTTTVALNTPTPDTATPETAPPTSIVAPDQDNLIPRVVETEEVSQPIESNEPAATFSPQDFAPTPPIPRVKRITTARVQSTQPAPRATTPTASNEPIALRPSSQTQRASSPAASAPQTSSSGGFVVQLSSQRSADQARTAFIGLQRRFSVLSSYSPIVKRADLGARGIFHRLQVGKFNSRSEAISLCENLKAAGGDCIVSRS
ncbi:MAG: SPOR domain-containing protein [Hyphomicrobiales bacterium]